MSPADLDARVEACACALLEAATAAGMAISGDGRVSERNAASLLAISAAYLKQLRLTGDGPKWIAAPIDGSRFGYRLRSLAEWIEMGQT